MCVVCMEPAEDATYRACCAAMNVCKSCRKTCSTQRCLCNTPISLASKNLECLPNLLARQLLNELPTVCLASPHCAVKGITVESLTRHLKSECKWLRLCSCDIAFPLSMIATHADMCDHVRITCPLCNLPGILRGEHRKHLNTCGGVWVHCDACRLHDTRKHVEDHKCAVKALRETVATLERQLADAKSAPMTSTEYKITDEMRQCNLLALPYLITTSPHLVAPWSQMTAPSMSCSLMRLTNTAESILHTASITVDVFTRTSPRMLVFTSTYERLFVVASSRLVVEPLSNNRRTINIKNETTNCNCLYRSNRAWTTYEDGADYLFHLALTADIWKSVRINCDSIETAKRITEFLRTMALEYRGAALT